MEEEIKNIEQYGKDILSGRIVACEYTRLSVKRHFDDLKRDDIYHDPTAALRVILFFRLLVHFKGKWKGQSFELSQWQKWVVWGLYGWKRQDGTRRFRVAWIDVARKNGKSSFAAGLCLYHLVMDGENSPEVYTAANKRDQARIVLDIAREIGKKSKALTKLRVREHDILAPDSGKMQALSADSSTLDGLNPSFAVVDELHASPNLKVFDTLISGQGSREQPLILMITTAGFQKDAEAFEFRKMLLDVLRGVKTQDDHFVMVYSLDEKDQWKDPETWQKANPGLGETVSMEYLSGQAELAKKGSKRMINFVCKNLNVWTSAPDVWIEDSVWTAAGSEIDESILKGAECWGGLDLAPKHDLSAFVLLFKTGETWVCKMWCWATETSVRKAEDQVDYWLWKKQGVIEVMPGDLMDFEVIADKIRELITVYNVQGVAYDSYKMFTVLEHLKKHNIPTEDLFQSFPQGTRAMGPIMVELEQLIRSKKLNHLGNPILRWMVTNVEPWFDSGGNMKIKKQSEIQKIDGLVSLAMAYGQFRREPEGKNAPITIKEFTVLPNIKL